MKWIVVNVFGGLIWLTGLAFAKGLTLPDSVANGDYRIVIGIGFGTLGLALLLWMNLRSTA